MIRVKCPECQLSQYADNPAARKCQKCGYYFFVQAHKDDKIPDEVKDMFGTLGTEPTEPYDLP